MVDSITDGDVQRIEGFIDVSSGESQSSIEDKLSNRFEQFSDNAVKAFAERIRERNKEIGGVGGTQREVERIIDEELTTASGSGVTGKRTTMVRSSDGAYFGKKSDEDTYIDRWGNVMGYKKGTNQRKKLIDSSDLEDI